MAFDEKNIQTLRDGLKEINEASTKVRNSSELQERLQSISRQGEMFKKLLANPDQAILTAYWELVQDQIRNVRLFLDTKQESMASEEDEPAGEAGRSGGPGSRRERYGQRESGHHWRGRSAWRDDESLPDCQQSRADEHLVDF